jgi:uncharacterized protein with HEPN domain
MRLGVEPSFSSEGMDEAALPWWEITGRRDVLIVEYMEEGRPLTMWS